MSFFPLDRDVLTSSVWAQGSPEAVKIWFYLLLEADHRTGIVADAAPAIALRCGLPLEVTVRELQWLAAPDEHSRTKAHDGRRIESLPDGGYRLFNYLTRQDKDYSTVRTRSWRERSRTLANASKRSRTLRNGRKRPAFPGTTDTDKNNGALNDGRSTTAPVPCTTPVEERVSGADAPATSLSWSKEACDDWIAAYEGTAPGGPIGRHLKPLVAKYGWAKVRSAWKAYLADTEPQFANPARFAATYGSWKTTPGPTKPPPQEPLPACDQAARAFFEAVKLRLSGTLPREAIATWFRPTFGRAWEGTTLVLTVPTKQFAEQMRFYAPKLRAAAAELERPEITFRVIVSEAAGGDD